MARQDLAYSITVNDAQLRLATQHVAAFNAELATSTVTGRKVDEQMRALGRRSAQVGGFFIRNLTTPLLLAGAAAAKYSYDFEKAAAKVQGLAGTTSQDLGKLNQAAFALASKEATLGPNQLETAIFHLKSAGLSTAQTIRDLKPVSEAAVAGLGNIASVTTAVTSAMDSYGFKNLSAAHATDVLIETVRKGNVPVQQLSTSIGRVTSIAAAMHISFDQIGAGIAAITRQMPNANLAVTGLRAILATFLRDAPQTEKALNAIGDSGAGVQKAFTSAGLFPTLIAIRSQFKGLTVDQKLLQQAYQNGGKSQATFLASLGNEGKALSKIFPNIRALAAFLAITGSNAKLNANIFAELSDTTKHTGEALQRAFGAFSTTPAGKLRAAISEIQVEAIKVGPTFIRMATSLLQLGNAAFQFFQHLGPFQGLLKSFGVGLLLFGPMVALFGRLTQGVSGGVTMWGKWQEAATLAAFKAEGVDIALAKNIISQRKATVQFGEGFSSIIAGAERAAAAVGAVGTAAAGAGAAAASALGVRGGIAAASGGSALLTKTSRGGKLSRGSSAPTPPEIPVSSPVVLGAIPALTDTDAQVQTRILQTQRDLKKQLRSANADLRASEQSLKTAIQSGVPPQIQYAAAQRATALASVQQAQTNLRLLIPSDAKLVLLDKELADAEAMLAFARRNGLGIAMAEQRVSTAQGAISVRQNELLGVEVKLRQAAADATVLQTAAIERSAALRLNAGIAAQTTNAADIQSGVLGASALLAAARVKKAASVALDLKDPMRIVATNWGTTIEGMKSVAKLGFGFIALTFATDVAGKMIFDSHHTRQAVERDWLGIAAVVGGAAIALSKTKGTGTTAAGSEVEISALAVLASRLKQVGAEGLSTKTKLALLATAMLGGQAAGVHLGSSISALGTYMLTKGVINSRLFGAALNKVGLSALVGRGGIIGLTLAIGQLADSYAPTHKLLGEVDRFFSKSIDPHIPFVGKWLSERDAKDAAHRLGEIGAAAKKLDPTAGLNDFQKNTLSAAKLNASQTAAVLDLFKHGQDAAAGNLINQAEFANAVAQSKNAIKILQADGHNAAAKMLQDFIGNAKQVKATYDALFGHIQTSLDNAFQARTGRILDTFDAKTQDILDTFDEKTQKLQDNLSVKVKLKTGLTFTIKVNGKTPAERELEALDKIQAKRTFERDLFDARQNLGTAFQIGDPNAIRDAERKLQDAQTEQKRFTLEAQAKTQRTAADAAIKTGTQALGDSRKRERQAIDTNRQTVRRNLEATRTIEEQNLNAALTGQATIFKNGGENLAQYQANVEKIMTKFNITIAGAGRDGGKAYADQMQMYFTQLQNFVTKSTDKMAADADKLTARLALQARSVAANLKFLGLAGIANPGVPGIKGQGSITPQTIAAGTPAVVAARQSAATLVTKLGIPTRPAIIEALRQINGGVEYTRYGRDIPTVGNPSEKEYKEFLADITDKDVRAELRSRLKAAFVRANTGAVVPGQGTRDTVPAMLTPGEIVFNRKQQKHLGDRLGMPGASAHELFDEIHKPQRFARGGVVLANAIRRMHGQGYSNKRIAGQVHRWHPDWSMDEINATVLEDEQSRLEQANRDGGIHIAHDRSKSTPFYRGQKPSYYETMIATGRGMYPRHTDQPLNSRSQPIYTIPKAGAGGDDLAQWNSQTAAWASSESVKNQGVLGTILRSTLQSLVPAKTLSDLASGRHVSVGSIKSDLINAALTFAPVGKVASVFAAGTRSTREVAEALTVLRRSAAAIRAGHGFTPEAVKALEHLGKPFKIASSDRAVLPRDDGFFYHGTNSGDQILDSRKVLATAAERAGGGRGPSGAWFTKNPDAAGFWGKEIVAVPEGLVASQLQKHPLGIFSSATDVVFGGASRSVRAGKDLRRALSQKEVQIFGEFEPKEELYPEDYARFRSKSLRGQAVEARALMSAADARIRSAAKHLGLSISDIRPGLGAWRGEKNIGYGIHIPVPKGGYSADFDKKVKALASYVGQTFKQGSLSYGRPLAAGAKGADVFPGRFWNAGAADIGKVQAQLDAAYGEGSVGVMHSPSRKGYYVVDFGGIGADKFSQTLDHLGIQGTPISWQGNYVFDRRLPHYGIPGAKPTSFQTALGKKSIRGTKFDRAKGALSHLAHDESGHLALGGREFPIGPDTEHGRIPYLVDQAGHFWMGRPGEHHYNILRENQLPGGVANYGQGDVNFLYDPQTARSSLTVQPAIGRFQPDEDIANSWKQPPSLALRRSARRSLERNLISGSTRDRFGQLDRFNNGSAKKMMRLFIQDESGSLSLGATRRGAAAADAIRPFNGATAQRGLDAAVRANKGKKLWSVPDASKLFGKSPRAAMRHIYDMATQFHQYRRWYDAAGMVGAEAAKIEGVSPEQMLSVLAMTSAKQLVSGNFRSAVEAIRAFKASGIVKAADFSKGSFYNAQIPKIQAILSDPSAVVFGASPKYQSYIYNLLEATDPEAAAAFGKKYGLSNEATVDSHSSGLVAPKLTTTNYSKRARELTSLEQRRTISALIEKGADPKAVARQYNLEPRDVQKSYSPSSSYNYLAEMYRQVAMQLGWPTREVQAASWVPQRAFGKAEKYNSNDWNQYIEASADAYFTGFESIYGKAAAAKLLKQIKTKTGYPIKGFRHGGVIPGMGEGDTVPAMLTPGEMVLNRSQQNALSSRLGMPGASAGSLFSAIAQRFASGGVVKRPQTDPSASWYPYNSDKTLPTLKIDGISDLNGTLTKLVRLMAKNAIGADEQTSPVISAAMNELTLGGHLTKNGKLIRDSAKKISALRKSFDPVSAESELRSTVPHFESLSADKRRIAEAVVARAMAHPVSAGLFTPHASGPDTVGGTMRLRAPREISATAFEGSGSTHVDKIEIYIDGTGKDEKTIAREVGREFANAATHTVVRRRGGYAGRH